MFQPSRKLPRRPASEKLTADCTFCLPTSFCSFQEGTLSCYAQSGIQQYLDANGVIQYSNSRLSSVSASSVVRPTRSNLSRSILSKVSAGVWAFWSAPSQWT